MPRRAFSPRTSFAERPRPALHPRSEPSAVYLLALVFCPRCRMAISLSCPTCDKTLKVKDELAGRKVKCPGCGEAVPVPAGDEAAVVSAEKLPRGKPLPVEDEEDRPRKKKKKKKSNLGLWIGVGGGGLALLLLIGCGIGAFFYFKTPGEKKLDDQAKAKPEPKREDDGKKPPPPPQK